MSKSFDLSLAAFLLWVPPAIQTRQPSRGELGLAQRTMDMAVMGHLSGLRERMRTASDPIERLFDAYALYQSDPKENADCFTNAFPTTEEGLERLLDLNETIPYSPEGEGNEYRDPRVKWTIGFESIYNAYLQRVQAGDPEALKRFLALEGHGDGAVGEEIAGDIAELFHHPAYVLAHWDQLEPHKAFLRSVKTWVTPKEFRSIRNGYLKLLPSNDRRRRVILYLLDHPE
jgi:hypothetical protein